MQEWSYLRGGLTTLDRDFGIFNKIHHDIGTHVIHHLFPQVGSKGGGMVGRLKGHKGSGMIGSLQCAARAGAWLEGWRGTRAVAWL